MKKKTFSRIFLLVPISSNLLDSFRQKLHRRLIRHVYQLFRCSTCKQVNRDKNHNLIPSRVFFFQVLFNDCNDTMKYVIFMIITNCVIFMIITNCVIFMIITNCVIFMIYTNCVIFINDSKFQSCSFNYKKYIIVWITSF